MSRAAVAAAPPSCSPRPRGGRRWRRRLRRRRFLRARPLWARSRERASERASEAEPAAEEPSAGPAQPAPRTKAAMKPGPPRRGAAHGPRVDTTTHAPGARGLLLPPLLLLLLAGRAAGVSDGPQEGPSRVPPRVSACTLAARSTLGVSRSRGVLSPPGSVCVRYTPGGLLPAPTSSLAAHRALGASEGEG